jgi:hypothetical protein
LQARETITKTRENNTNKWIPLFFPLDFSGGFVIIALHSFPEYINRLDSYRS